MLIASPALSPGKRRGATKGGLGRPREPGRFALGLSNSISAKPESYNFDLYKTI